MSIDPAYRRSLARALDWFFRGLFVAYHLSVVFVFFVPFSWHLVALAATTYVVRMWAIALGYHRYFSHRSYKTSRAFQFVMAAVGTSALQQGPIWWASWHRRHHRDSDTPRDPHSPVQRGFFYAQVGWIFDSSLVSDPSNVKDLSRFPELRALDRLWWLPPTLLGIACFAIAGVPGLVWGFGVSSVATLHVTGLVNSLGHLWGSRPYATGDASRNNALLAALTFGDGWHNNHHHRMGSARHGFRWWELDIGYASLLLLERLGLIWDLRLPQLDSRAAASAEPRVVMIRPGASTSASLAPAPCGAADLVSTSSPRATKHDARAS